jgi:toxin ParE1/3/4
MLTEYDPKLRYLLYGNKPHVYRILYRIDEKSRTVAIRHIRHGARTPIKSS